MDFRICPACKSSVLEDDVQDCPFCGASMSGKPSSGKPKPATPGKPAGAVKPAGPAAKTAPAAAGGAAPARKPAGPTAAAAKPDAGDGDPFDVDTTAVRKAVKLIPKPIKTRSHEVKCPMCETIGYMDPELAGKDVQCCNPECMVPVFKSARLKIEEAPQVAPDHRKLKLLAAGTAVLLLGTAVWYFVIREEKKPVTMNDDPLVKPTVELPTLPDNKATQPVAARALTPEEIRGQALARIVDQSRQRTRNSAFAAHLASDALAAAGRLKEAQDQLRRLQDMGKATVYYHVQPLVSIAWGHLSGGNVQGANEAAGLALTKAKEMSQYTRDSHDAGVALGALLIALDRAADAEPVIQQHQNLGEKGIMSAIYRAAVEGKSFDAEKEARYTWHAVMPEPMRIGIVETLVSRGHEAKGLAFAQAIPGQASREACLAAWAGRLTALNRTAAIPRIQAVAGEATPTAQCRIWSAVASAAQTAGDQTLVATSLASAEAAVAKLPEPQGPLAVPSKSDLVRDQDKPNVGLPDPAPAQAEGLAYLDLALLRQALGNEEEAWSFLQGAVERTRTTTPGPVATQAMYDECQNEQALVKRELGTLMKLTADDRITRAFNRYRALTQKVDALADELQAFRVQILRAVAERGLRTKIWDYARAQATAEDRNLRQPYLESTLPGLIKAHAQESKDDALAAAVDAAYETTRVQVDPIDGLQVKAEALLAAKDLKNAAEVVKQTFRGDVNAQRPDRMDLLAHRLTARVAASHSLPETNEFVLGLFDSEFKQDAFLLLAGGSVNRGKAPELWNLMEPSRDLEPVDRVACYRGFIAAIPAPPKATAPPAEPQASAPSSQSAK